MADVVLPQMEPDNGMTTAMETTAMGTTSRLSECYFSISDVSYGSAAVRAQRTFPARQAIHFAQ